MKIQQLGIVAILFAAPAQSSAIYHCVIDGVSVFSSSPCAEHSEVITPQYQQPSPEERARTAQRNQQLESALQQRHHQQTIKRLEDQIKHVEDRIRQLRSNRDAALNQLRAQRDQDLAQLRDRRDRSNRLDEQAEATIHQSLSLEMQAVNQRYDSELQIQRDEIERLRSDLAKQQSPP